MRDEISQQRTKEHDYLRAAELTKNVLNSNRTTLIDLILKLEEIDESNGIVDNDKIDTAILIAGKLSNEALLLVCRLSYLCCVSNNNIISFGFIEGFEQETAQRINTYSPTDSRVG